MLRTTSLTVHFGFLTTLLMFLSSSCGGESSGNATTPVRLFRTVGTKSSTLTVGSGPRGIFVAHSLETETGATDGWTIRSGDEPRERRRVAMHGGWESASQGPLRGAALGFLFLSVAPLVPGALSPAWLSTVTTDSDRDQSGALGFEFEPFDVEGDLASLSAQCASENPIRTYFSPFWHVRARSAPGGDGAFVASSNCGFVRLTRFGPLGEVRWDLSVIRMVGVAGMATIVGEPMLGAMDVDDAGFTALVVRFSDGWEGVGLARAAGLASVTPGDSMVVFVSPEGVVTWKTPIHESNAPNFRAVTIGPERVTVLGNVSVLRDHGVGDRADDDLSLVALSRTTGAVLAQRTTDIDNEDSGDAIVASVTGDLFVGARTGATQVDTGSIVTFPHIVVLTLNPNLEERERIRFGSARADIVREMRLTASGGLLVAGGFNGPITHTEASERYTNAFWMLLPPTGFGGLAVSPFAWSPSEE